MKPLDTIKKKRAQAINRIISNGYLSKYRVYVGMATCEIAAGSQEVMDEFKKAVSKGLTNVYLSKKGCAGRCNLEPTVEIIEENKIPIKYCKINREKAKKIIEEHIKKGKVIEEWIIE